MPKSFIRESIELGRIELDDTGFASVVKRINLKGGYRHRVAQVDLFQDSIPLHTGSSQTGLYVEIAVSPYPILPTEMNFKTPSPALGNRMPSASNDTILFKASSAIRDTEISLLNQFPSPQLATNPDYAFYSNELYITLYCHGEADEQVLGLSLSFYLMLDNKKVDAVEAGIGILREQHEAHCMELTSNGTLISQATLKGNVFPMWRFGGIRPERMLTPDFQGGFFLPTLNTDGEFMSSTSEIRAVVAQARSMSAFDEAFGGETTFDIPDWCRMNLMEGIVSGPVRDQWPPTKHADNGNVLMF